MTEDPTQNLELVSILIMDRGKRRKIGENHKILLPGLVFRLKQRREKVSKHSEMCVPTMCAITEGSTLLSLWFDASCVVLCDMFVTEDAANVGTSSTWWKVDTMDIRLNPFAKARSPVCVICEVQEGPLPMSSSSSSSSDAESTNDWSVWLAASTRVF